MTRNQLKIIRLIKKLGISQSSFAESLGVTSMAVSHWVNGNKNPSAPVMKLIKQIYK